MIAAAAGVGLVLAGVNESIGKYESLGEQVENYSRVVGGSAEESGRMVQTFEALGVSGDTATAAMFKLSKAIETHPAKLEALGVAVAKNAVGNVDLNKTLLNMADAYNALSDPTKRNILLFDAFGKSGKDMIPILEQGSAALQQLEASARMTFTEEDLQRLRDVKIKNEEIKQSWDSMWQSLGQKLIPIEEALSTSYLRSEYAQQQLTKAQADGTEAMATTVIGQRMLLEKYGQQYDAGQKVKVGVDTLAQATRDAALANDELWTSMDKLIGQEEALKNASFALRQADLAVNESQGKVQLAWEALQTAIAKYGKGSDEAALAADNLTRTQIDQEKAYYADAAAARKLQEDTDLATTGQKDAKLEAEAYINQLQLQADHLAPGSALRVNLEAYIHKLRDEIPHDVHTILHFRSVDDGGSTTTAGGTKGYAAGGRPAVGIPSWVGERGPELFVPDRPGTITPMAQLPPGATSQASMATVESLLSQSLALQAAAEAHLADLAGRQPLSASAGARRQG
jgi:hypothetical protein